MEVAGLTRAGEEGVLSQVGQHRVRQIAEEKARIIDERNSDWRYHADFILGLMHSFASIGMVLTILFALYLLIAGGPLTPVWEPFMVNGVGIIVPYWLRTKIANPEVRAGD